MAKSQTVQCRCLKQCVGSRCGPLRQNCTGPVGCKCSSLTVHIVIFLRSFFFFFFCLKKDIGNVNVEFFHFVFFFLILRTFAQWFLQRIVFTGLRIRRENRSIPAQSRLVVLCRPSPTLVQFPTKRFFRETVLDLISFEINPALLFPSALPMRREQAGCCVYCNDAGFRSSQPYGVSERSRGGSCGPRCVGKTTLTLKATLTISRGP